MEQTDITTRGTLKDAAAVNTDITQTVKSYIQSGTTPTDPLITVSVRYQISKATEHWKYPDQNYYESLQRTKSAHMVAL